MLMQNLAGQTRCKMGCARGELLLSWLFIWLPQRGLGWRGGGGSFGGLLLDKFLYKEDPPQGSTPYLLYTIFDRKSIPVVHFILTNGTHFTLYMLCLFNINKYFWSHKISLLVPLSFFTDRIDRFLYPFNRPPASTSEMATLSHTWSEKNVYPFWAEPPGIAHSL